MGVLVAVGVSVNVGGSVIVGVGDKLGVAVNRGVLVNKSVGRSVLVGRGVVCCDLAWERVGIPPRLTANTPINAAVHTHVSAIRRCITTSNPEYSRAEVYTRA